MSESVLNPLESILRMCAAAAPEPWYPRLFAKQTDVDPRALGQCLEELWLNGLIEKSPGTNETGPAISLTREGERVLLDPEALERLRAGQPLSSSDRGAIIRQALGGGMRPRITVLLVLLNVLVFAGGWYAARQIGADNDFLRGIPVTVQVGKLLDKSGAVSARDLIDGQWWRLLTSGFVHIGFMHLLMNMACLYLIGRFIEQRWGHVRYLVIYLVGVLGGSCLGVVHHVGLNAGASGAVCGLLGSEAVWFLFNRKYLPRSLLRQAWTTLLINLVLLVFISSFESVSGWGHFGGAAAGALAALLLHLHRFGPPLWRWLALAGFVPLAWYGDYVIEQARAKDPKWQEVEKQVFDLHYPDPVAQTLAEVDSFYERRALPVLERHPDRRDAASIEKVLAELTEQRAKLQALEDKLVKAGPFFNQDVEEDRQTLRDRIADRLRLLDSAEQCLRAGEKWQSPTEQEEREFEVRYLRKTDTTLSAARALYQQQIRPLLALAPPRRTAGAIEKVQTILEEQRPQVADVLDALNKAGPYHDESAEKARHTARSYAAAVAELLESAQRHLKAGADRTDEDKEKLKKQEKQVDRWRQEWRELVE